MHLSADRDMLALLIHVYMHPDSHWSPNGLPAMSG